MGAENQRQSGLVGRRRELEVLLAALGAGLAGRGSVALVGGEPGIGKTRLVEELAGRARDRGATVVWARCWEGDLAPLWPWAAVLGTLADQGLVADAGMAEGGGVGPVLDLEPGAERVRLFDRVGRNLRGAAAKAPLLVVLDDLQWADGSSLQLLVQLSACLPTAPLLVVATYRDTEAGDALGPMFARLSCDVVHVGLGGLAAAEVATLAGVDDGVAADLYDRTAGNPFLVGELARLVADDGGTGTMAVGRLPAGAGAVLAGRIARLSPGCRDGLAAAAVLGRGFDCEVLAGMAGLDTDAVASMVDEGVARRVLVETGPGGCAFVHDLFREAFVASLGRGRRQRLHLAAGEAIEHRHAGHLEPHLPALARHFVAAGPGSGAARAAVYSRQAGRRAAAALAFDDAVTHFEQALTAAGPTVGERAALLVDLGAARSRAGDRARGRADLAAAAELARRAGDAETFAAAALAHAGGVGGNHPLAEPDRALVALLDEALERLRTGDTALRCRVLARLAAELSLTDDVQRRLRLSSEALGRARRLDDPRVLASALYARHIAASGPDDVDERAAAADELRALADEAGDLDLSLLARMLAVRVRQERCQPFAEELARCARLAESRGLPGFRAEVALRQVMASMMAGRFDEAMSLFGLVEVTAGADEVVASTVRSALSLQMMLRGPLDALVPTVEAIVADRPRPLWQAALAALHADLEHREEAERAYADLADRAATLPRDGLWLATMFFLGFACFALDDRRRAAALHGLLAPYSGLAPLDAFGSVATAVGLLEATLGRFRDALSSLGRGRDANLAGGNLAFALWAHRETAAVLLRRDGPGDRAAATTILDEVISGLRAAGFDGFVERAERLRAAAGGGGGQCRLLRDGATWVASYRGAEVRLVPSKGLADLAALLACPGREVAAVDLAGTLSGAGTGGLLDVRGRRELRDRLVDLEDEVTEAEAFGDPARAGTARAEQDAIVAHLTAATGLGGRARRSGDGAERARKAVTWRIRQAIRTITAVDPRLGGHLDRCVRTGSFCSYRPEPAGAKQP